MLSASGFSTLAGLSAVSIDSFIRVVASTSESVLLVRKAASKERGKRNGPVGMGGLENRRYMDLESLRVEVVNGMEISMDRFGSAWEREIADTTSCCGSFVLGSVDFTLATNVLNGSSRQKELDGSGHEPAFTISHFCIASSPHSCLLEISKRPASTRADANTVHRS